MEDQLLGNQDMKLRVLLRQASEAIQTARNRELSRYGIKFRQGAILFYIKVVSKSEGEATPGKIAKWMLRKPDTVSRILVRMEKEGLIIKSRRKNETIVTLTEKGEQAYIQSTIRKTLREIMSCLSIEERQQLHLSLKKLRDNAASNLNKARNNQSFASDKLSQLL